MEILTIIGTDETPSVNLNCNGLLEFSGHSRPENVNVFYAPVFDWIKKYKEIASETTLVKFKVGYLNTSSCKVILDILLLLEEILVAGKKVRVEWYFPKNDDDMEDAGQEFSELVAIPFKITEY